MTTLGLNGKMDEDGRFGTKHCSKQTIWDTCDHEVEICCRRGSINRQQVREDERRLPRRERLSGSLEPHTNDALGPYF